MFTSAIFLLIAHAVGAERAEPIKDVFRRGARPSASSSHAPAALLKADHVAHLHATEEDPMKTVEHQKTAGSGYKEGSPLYEAQQKEAIKGAASAVNPVESAVPFGGDPEQVSPTISSEANRISEGKLPRYMTDTGSLMAAALGGLGAFLLIACCAFVYQKNKVDPQQPPRDGLDHSAALLDRGDWRFGLFDCMHTPMICVLACCFPCIRWGDTMRMAGFMSFWAAVLIFDFLYCANSATSGLTMLIVVMIATYQRQAIRRLFGMKSGTAETAKDCAIYCCCSPCAIVQEARQLEEAYAVQHRAVSAKVGAPYPSRPNY